MDCKMSRGKLDIDSSKQDLNLNDTPFKPVANTATHYKTTPYIYEKSYTINISNNKV